MTVLPHIMPSYGEATTLSGLLAAMQSIFVAVRMHKHLHWRRLLPILTTFMIVSYFAVMTVAHLDDHILKRILGAILILVSIYLFAFSKKIKLKPTPTVQIGMGSISGLMGGFFAMQGPPAVLYFLAAEREKEGYMANLQTYLLMSNILMTTFRARAGFLTPAVGTAWCYAILAVIIGTTLGAIVFRHIPTPLLRKIIYIYMAVSGIVAML